MIIYMLQTFDPTHTLAVFPRLAKLGTLQWYQSFIPASL
jgi:hypothetical protein